MLYVQLHSGSQYPVEWCTSVLRMYIQMYAGGRLSTGLREGFNLKCKAEGNVIQRVYHARTKVDGTLLQAQMQHLEYHSLYNLVTSNSDLYPILPFRTRRSP